MFTYKAKNIPINSFKEKANAIGSKMSRQGIFENLQRFCKKLGSMSPINFVTESHRVT